MSVAAPVPEVRVRALRLAHVGTVPLLAALVALSTLGRLVAGWARSTPVYFPDEYLYAELGRSFAESGERLVRGATTTFPSLLQPVVTAPVWLLDDVETSYRLIQGIGALAMSLAAIPAFALARRAGLGRSFALAAAALAVAVPDLLFGGWVVAEPLAYPLALGALWAGVAAIDEPRPRHQLLFVLLAGLSILARVQLAALAVAFLVAVVAVGLHERRVRAVLREQALPLVLVALPLVAGAALLALGRLGPYSGGLDAEVEPLGTLAWAARNGLVLAYAAGFALVPGALVGLWLAVARPRDRAELAFGAGGVALAIALLVQAGVFSASFSGHAHERYVFVLVPLAAIGFGLWASRGFPLRLWHGLLAAAVCAAAAAVPLSGLAAAQGKADSPVLRAYGWLEDALGSSGSASLAVALAATVSVAAVALAVRGRAGAALGLGLSLVVCVLASAAAVAFDSANATRARAALLPGDASWVDAVGAGPVAYLATPGTEPGAAHALLFWNRSVDTVFLLEDARPFDGYASARATVASDGTLRVPGGTYVGPLVVDGTRTTAVLAGARAAAAAPRQTLWLPEGTPRLSLLLTGRSSSGWLETAAELRAWPTGPDGILAARVELDLRVPDGGRPTTIRLTSVDGQTASVTLEPGQSGRLWASVCALGPWQGTLEGTASLVAEGRPVAAQASVPRLVPDPAACAGRLPAPEPTVRAGATPFV